MLPVLFRTFLYAWKLLILSPPSLSYFVIPTPFRHKEPSRLIPHHKMSTSLLYFASCKSHIVQHVSLSLSVQHMHINRTVPTKNVLYLCQTSCLVTHFFTSCKHHKETASDAYEDHDYHTIANLSLPPLNRNHISPWSLLCRFLYFRFHHRVLRCIREIVVPSIINLVKQFQWNISTPSHSAGKSSEFFSYHLLLSHTSLPSKNRSKSSYILESENWCIVSIAFLTNSRSTVTTILTVSSNLLGVTFISILNTPLVFFKAAPSQSIFHFAFVASSSSPSQAPNTSAHRV